MKSYHYVMSQIYYFFGDLASKPLQLDWLNEDKPLNEWIATRIYNVYNWLMLKSVDHNDKGGLDIWSESKDA